MLTKPRRYQLEDARTIHRMGYRALISWHPGLGKSLEALWCAERAGALPCVVVCPASLKWNWERECEKHFGWRAAVLSGKRPAKRGPFGDFPVTVINYDVLHDWLPVLKEHGFKMLVADESQKLASRTTKRTKAVRELAQGIDLRLALSGTPILNRPADLWPTLNILRPDRFKSFFPYALEFCAARKMPWAWDFSGCSNPEKLHRILTEEMMVRRRKEDVLKDLPPKRRIVVPVEVSDRRQYELAHRDFVLWLARHKPEKMTAALRAERLVRAGYLKRLAAALKMPSVYEWLDTFLETTDEKIILFGIHRETVVGPTYERYRKQAEVIHGGIVGQQRMHNFDRFLRDPGCRLLVGNIEAAGVGLSALGVSNTAFAELAWRPSDHDQAEDRTHGLGRGSEGVRSTSYYFVAIDTIEQHLIELLHAKQRTISSVLDGGEGASEFDVLEQLTKRMTT